MKIYLVRHVETEGNVERRFNGITESEFTEYGLYMKSLLVDHLADFNYEGIEAIYTSPLKRASIIADELGEKLDITPVEVDTLKEYDFGIFDGLLPQEAEELYPDVFYRWINNHLYQKIPDGDTYQEKYLAVKEWIEEITEKEEETIVIVSHGATLRCILTYLLDLPLEAGWHIDIPLGGYCTVDYENGYGTLSALTTPPYENNDSAKFIKAFNS